MKITTLIVVSFLSISFFAKADEGMWLPILINQNMATMTDMGLELTADDIYNINQSSIKDAIIALDHGSCTGELISAEGLILTNHHCGYGEIQSHSTVDNDYLTNGFWAMSKDEELTNPGKTASFLIKVNNVTDRVIAAIPEGINQLTRNHIIDSISAVITEEATKDNNYNANVESMFKGNYYYLFIYETFRDIRLVGAPPESIGKYGSDTDNWMWPRHTGDFSLFRIYADTAGSPADYSENNVPYKPKHFLPISVDGYKKDDFAFIMGYPGSTARYLTSFGLKYIMDYENPNRVKIRGVKQSIWKKEMNKDAKIRIQYSSKFARSSNYWKYSIEQNKALKRLDVYGQKVEIEKDFTRWVNKNREREAKYGGALELIKKSIEATNEINSAKQYMLETLFHYYGEVYLFAYRANSLMTALEIGNVEDINSSVNNFRTQAEAFYKNYSVELDKKTSPALLKLFINDVSPEFYPSHINSIVLKKYKGDVDKYFNRFFEKSIFVDQIRMNKFLDDPSAKTLAKDPAFVAMTSTLMQLRAFYAIDKEYSLGKQEGMRLFVAGLLEMNMDKTYSPDANSTMRLTYGSVSDYSPGDAVQYRYFTTLKGVIEKEDATVREFNVPKKLKDIYNNKDYGQYGNKDGSMSVCFTTNNDITGGNSGSPVINAKGQLIGIAFDGNSESMSGDISFENSMQKCISVDIRYILLIIDKYAGAENLINEMDIIKTIPAHSTEVENATIETNDGEIDQYKLKIP